MCFVKGSHFTQLGLRGPSFWERGRKRVRRAPDGVDEGKREGGVREKKRKMACEEEKKE